jgi:hypothetical protein
VTRAIRANDPTMSAVPANSQPAPVQGTALTCRQCGYEVRGSALTGGMPVCPECGHKWPSGPLSGEDFAAIEAAQRRSKKVRKAARVASFNAWTAAIIGGSALCFGVIDRPSAILGGLIMIVAIIEFKGAAKFRRLDLAAPALCGLNQLLLLAIIGCYCLWSMTTQSQSVTQSIGDPMGDAVLADVAGMESTIRHAFYALVLGGSVLMQGFTAIYYFTRKRHMQAYLRETPPWIVELQKRTPA